MEHSVYYFTGTGNSLAIAREITRKTGARLIPLTKAIRSDSISGGTIGIVFPIYMLNAPRIVYDFIKKIRSCEYFYIVMTMGGGSGKTGKRIASITMAEGVPLDASFSLKMPDNYIAWNDATSPQRQRELFSLAELKIDQIIDTVKDRQPYFDDDSMWKNGPGDSSIPFPLSVLPPSGIQLFCNMGFRFINRLDIAFRATDRCTGCGICGRICPVGNITFINTKPVWNHRCEQCFACLHWCPQEAIEYGGKSAGRKRYHHPEVSIQDMMGQAENGGAEG